MCPRQKIFQNLPLKHIFDKAEQMKRLDTRYRYAVEQLTLQSLMRIREQRTWIAVKSLDVFGKEHPTCQIIC